MYVYKKMTHASFKIYNKMYTGIAPLFTLMWVHLQIRLNVY